MHQTAGCERGYVIHVNMITGFLAAAKQLDYSFLLRRAAEAVGFETRALHMHGPAGAGGGSDPLVREILAVQSVLLPRELVSPEIGLEGAA